MFEIKSSKSKEIFFSSLLALSAAILLTFLLKFKIGSFSLLNVLIFSFLAVACELTIIKIPIIGKVSMGRIVPLTVLVLFGPLSACFVAAIASLNWKNINKIDPFYIYFFKVGEAVFSTGVAGWIYYLLPGNFTLISKNANIQNVHYFLIAITVCSIIYFLINSILISASISFSGKTNILNIWQANFKWSAPAHFVLAPIAIFFAQIYKLAYPYQYLVVFLSATGLLIYRHTYKIYTDLQRAYTETITSFIKAIEAKDFYTKGHSERVAMHCEKLAMEIGLKKEDIESLKRAALLHDIGKIGIPKKILTKPDKLTDQEYAFIKEHPKIGAQILQRVEFLNDVIPAIFYHHEKIDGSGYATGIKGDSIPLFAKIISIADAFDAMTSNRAYRPALEMEEIVEEFNNNSGNQFDSTLAEVFSRTCIKTKLLTKNQENGDLNKISGNLGIGAQTS